MSTTVSSPAVTQFYAGVVAYLKDEDIVVRPVTVQQRQQNLALLPADNWLVAQVVVDPIDYEMPSINGVGMISHVN